MAGAALLKVCCLTGPCVFVVEPEGLPVRVSAARRFHEACVGWPRGRERMMSMSRESCMLHREA